jgi:hypothetical protein
LLTRLSQVSEAVVRNAQSPQAWRYQIEQADVLLQLAARAPQAERDNWLKMAIDSYYGAAVGCPDNEPQPPQRLAQLPGLISRYFSGNPLSSYAALQVIQADYNRALGKAGADPAPAQDQLRRRLVSFAQEHPKVPEAARALLEAGQFSESLGKPADACRCYRHLAETYPGQPLSRQARGALRRLGGLDNTPFELRLPLLYSAGTHERPFDIKELRGALVLVTFWSSTHPQAAESFDTLKRLTDRYLPRGLQVVYVNLDGDPARAREFLAGRLTAGTHIFDPVGLNGIIAERYGVQDLPQIFLVSADGTLLRHSLQPSQLETELLDRLGRAH